MITTSYKPVYSISALTVLGLLTLLAGSVVLGIIALLWKVMQLIHLVTP